MRRARVIIGRLGAQAQLLHARLEGRGDSGAASGPPPGASAGAVGDFEAPRLWSSLTDAVKTGSQGLRGLVSDLSSTLKASKDAPPPESVC